MAALVSLPLWCPMKGCVGDAPWLSSQHMSNPSPSPSHDGGFHAVLDAEGEKIFVGDGLGSEYSQDSSKVLRWQFVQVAFTHSPTFWAAFPFAFWVSWRFAALVQLSIGAVLGCDITCWRAFWRRSSPCWGDSWCRCLQDIHRSLWPTRGLGHPSSSLPSSSGWSIGLIVVQTYRDGWFLLHVLMSVLDRR